MIIVINKAIEFATICHGNRTRKETDIPPPYILHCLEAGTLAANMTNKGGSVDCDTVSAAILHDTIEDAFVSYGTLKEVFNENIADLVQSQSEDKSKKWIDRKLDIINFLQTNKSKSVEIATLADKLSNMRSISRDYEVEQEALWEKFNAGKDKQHWYYQSIAASLRQVTNTVEYQEYTTLIKRVFER